MVVVVIVPAVAIVVAVMVPMVVMVKAAVIAVPIAGVILAAFMARSYPMRSLVWRPCPIAGVPFVMPSDGIPVALNPYKIRPWTSRNYTNYARRRRIPDADSNGNLSG
jgi:hypothetical protein